MRGLRKPWPPANVSPDNQQPCRFIDAEQTFITALATATNRTLCARGHFDQLEKSRLREVMLREQGHLCVYCERRLGEYPTPRIEHWRPLSLNHEVALHWKNLYLSCASLETCDTAKGNRHLRWADTEPDLPWPTECDFERYIGFTSGGEMYVRGDVMIDEATRRALAVAIDDQQDGERRIPAVVRLNHPSLVEARAAALDSERTRMKLRYLNKTVSRDERDQVASERLDANPLPEFVSIRVAWLRKMLGAGR